VDEPQSGDDDDDLALKMSYKDVGALLEFQRRHYRKVKGALLRQYYGVLDEYEVDWVLNEAVLKVYEKAERFDSKKGTLLEWFATVAVNTARDLLRSGPQEKSRPPDFIDECGAYRPRLPYDDDVEDGPALKAMLHFIDTKFRGLQQKVLLADLAAGGEADIKWLAEKFSSTPGSIKSTRSNARSKLRQLMIEWASKQERYRGKI
jgi:DNA-directed RNA polymerase specialized sigma24 family protein